MPRGVYKRAKKKLDKAVADLAPQPVVRITFEGYKVVTDGGVDMKYVESVVRALGANGKAYLTVGSTKLRIA
jgi:hypothetical protein